MADADIGAHGAVWVGLESVYGTPSDPSASGMGTWVPVISEALVYTEPNRYYSEQIRQQTMVSDVKQSYYHVEGDIVFEVDPTYMPYFMVASRHTTSESGSGPFTYTSIPGGQGTTYPGGSAIGLSIAVDRDNVGFIYSGCVVNQFAFTIENGVLRCTLSILGLAEQEAAGAFSPSWVDAVLYGADAHAIYVADADASPSFSDFDPTFNGFTLTINHNGEPQNRITRARSASYIKYGISEVSYDTELDFTDRTEYDHFVAAEQRAVRFESINPGGVGGDWGSADNGFRATLDRTVYNTYETNLGAMADLVMARVNGRALAIAGGDGYTLECISPTDLSL